MRSRVVKLPVSKQLCPSFINASSVYRFNATLCTLPPNTMAFVSVCVAPGMRAVAPTKSSRSSRPSAGVPSITARCTPFFCQPPRGFYRNTGVWDDAAAGAMRVSAAKRVPARMACCCCSSKCCRHWAQHLASAHCLYGRVGCLHAHLQTCGNCTTSTYSSVVQHCLMQKSRPVYVYLQKAVVHAGCMHACMHIRLACMEDAHSTQAAACATHIGSLQ
jgi:hypothetical protein